MSQLETSVGGKTVPPGGNPVFQSPPPLSLPREPVQTSTDLRNLSSPQTVTIQIHKQPDWLQLHTDVREGRRGAWEKWLHFAFFRVNS